MPIRVTVWNEYVHEKSDPEAAARYPDGIHAFLRDVLKSEEIEVTTATLDEPEQGLPDAVLSSTDVLIWWGHVRHKLVADELVERIEKRVQEGMGMIFLHSAHKSKPFRRIIGTTGNLTWGREQRCVLWNMMPTHPIAKGVPAHFELFEELYSEPFFVPKPDDLIFATWYEDGNLFRGGMTYTRGLGKIFYFHPGHETCSSYYDPNVQRILKNAVAWCAPAEHEEFDNSKCHKQTERIV